MTNLLELWPMLATWGLVIALGALVSYYGFKSWRSNKSMNMLLLSGGFVLLSVVPGLSWFGLYLMGVNLFTAEVSCTAIMGAGFVVILASLRLRSG